MRARRGAQLAGSTHERALYRAPHASSRPLRVRDQVVSIDAARITVVVPCCDDGATVREAVDSVREAEPVDIVVVDDGSRDPRTIAVLDALAAHDRIRLVRQPNGGVASALRAGFEVARGPYVFVLCADDVAAAGALAELADRLDASPSHDFAFGHSHHFGDVDFIRLAAPWNPWILLHSNLWEISCLFRREVVGSVGGFPSDSGYEDWDLFMALAERGSEGLLVDRLVFHYRIRRRGRKNASVMLRFREHYETLHASHQALFERERELRGRYPLPRWVRQLYRLQLAFALRLPPPLVRPLLDVKRRLRPLVGWVDAARR
ncbi:MAG: hypothetical protein QOK36_3793 [Gaiellales bacterium]|jgi:glycosyltransferase involved in cell wall biosynthesis|nr:hypothetical protein [Gaiellales bacterium]